jgi:secreted repeat protein with Y-X4-D motif
MFVPDGARRVTCTGGCAFGWPPLKLHAGETVAAGAGARAGLLGTMPNPGGGRVITYHGWPLYTYLGDASAGHAAGQGKDEDGGYWYVMRPSGQIVGGLEARGRAPASSRPEWSLHVPRDIPRRPRRRTRTARRSGRPAAVIARGGDHAPAFVSERQSVLLALVDCQQGPLSRWTTTRVQGVALATQRSGNDRRWRGQQATRSCLSTGMWPSPGRHPHRAETEHASVRLPTGPLLTMGSK